MIRCTVKGDFKKTYNFLNRIRKLDFDSLLKKYGEEGIKALADATPKRTGKTAASWGYRIEQKPGQISIVWTNSNMAEHVPVVVILEYGHGTANGGYVEGRHFISPAIRPVFDKIADTAWKEVFEKK
jgi:hypothetical protein